MPIVNKHSKHSDYREAALPFLEWMRSFTTKAQNDFKQAKQIKAKKQGSSKRQRFKSKKELNQ